MIQETPFLLNKNKPRCHYFNLCMSGEAGGGKIWLKETKKKYPLGERDFGRGTKNKIYQENTIIEVSTHDPSVFLPKKNHQLGKGGDAS